MANFHKIMIQRKSDIMETQKGKKLTEWAEKAFAEYKAKQVTYDDYSYDGLKKAFIEAIRERDQYLIDTYFAPPKGIEVTSLNMNDGGFVELEDRIFAHRNFEHTLWDEACKKASKDVKP
jgi:hypothetical protein